MRGVVIADNQGIALEVISTSMEDKEMAEYTLGLVKQILQHRSRLLDRTCRFEEVGTSHCKKVSYYQTYL